MLEKRHNFTLIELILASVILLIAVLGTASFFFAGRRSLARARIQREATWAAVDAMEKYKSTGEGLTEEEIPLLYHTGSIDIEVVKYDANDEEIVNGEGNGEEAIYRKVTVTVTWNDGLDQKKLVTYIAGAGD